MPERHTGDQYPAWVGFIFVFNLIVGTGALTLPAVFAKAGWLLGFIVICILAFISYITVTFIIETMACANAIMYWKRMQYIKRDTLTDEDFLRVDDGHEQIQNNSSSDVELFYDNDVTIEQRPLFEQNTVNYYILDKKLEMGEMAGLFFNNIGRILFYLCISIYLYGDLSIYSAAVAKTMRDIICESTNNTNETDNFLNDTDLCWKTHTITRIDCYRLSLIGFIMLLGPFVFFNVQKTKYIQIFTLVFRFLAFTLMITIAVKLLIENGNIGQPVLANYIGLPSLFGTCVYSFMCHHSLPSLVTPIHNKKVFLKRILSIDYILITSFYILLAITGAFAFAHLNDLYTLNFIPNANTTDNNIFYKFIEYSLALFPVLTLSTSFPIIGITLRNNLQSLFLDTSHLESYNFLLRKLFFPLLTIIPPIMITYFTDSLTSLVGFTGSYAGTGIQYLLPIFLVYYARQTCRDILGQGIINDYQSPFKHNCWLIFVFIWSITCVILVTINFFYQF